MPDKATLFLEKGRKLIERKPDFNDTLMAAHEKGLTISPEAVAEIVRLGTPEVAYYLAKPENFDLAHKLHGMAAHDQVVEVGKIAEQLRRNRTMDDMEPDDYLQKRRHELMYGYRRR
jgi:hypothetical protein